MNDLVLADTGPLYALADRSDQYHERARHERDVLTRRRARIAVAQTTVFETHNLVVRRLGPAWALDWLDQMSSNLVLVPPMGDDYDDAIERVRRYHDQPITLFDALLAGVGERLGAPIWTYDHHFDVMRTAVWR